MTVIPTMLKLKLLFSAFTLFAFAGVVSAQDLFTWSYTAGTYSASGTLVATMASSAFEWDVNSISGTWVTPSGTNTINGLASGFGNDNVFYYGFSGNSSSLGNGIGFTNSTNSDVVVFNNGDQLIYTGDSSTPSSTTPYTPSDAAPNGYLFTEIGPASAPWEPSDAVFISGAILFGWMQYRRMRRKSVA